MAKKVTAIQSEDKIAVRLVVLLPMVEFDTSTFHVSLSNTFKRNLRLPWLRIHHQNWLLRVQQLVWQVWHPMYNWPSQFFFFQLFFPKSLSSYIRLLSLFIIYDSYFTLSLALDQALRGASSNYVSGISMLLSFQISANQRECKQTLKNTCQG